MTFGNRYGFFDRMLHRIAFSLRLPQLGMADLETRLYRKELAAIEPGAPILITALPRAGTTILLELIAALPEFAAHTYREMPFVLCPMLWRGSGRRKQRDDTPRERAHADGLMVSLDSPEAFEEMVWRAFWKAHYRGDRITPWDRCDDDEFCEFFAAHRHKVIALRARDKSTARRYVSKNNLNIARLPGLFDAVPDATVLVPVREPLQHAASLLRQHLRFLEMHAADRFARRYMAGIGHFDFGANLRPVDFGGWIDAQPDRDATQLAFWLDYWVATHQHVLEQADHARIHVLTFEALGAARTLEPLAGAIGVESDSLDAQLGRLRTAPGHDVDARGLPAQRVEAARGLYAELARRSLLRG